MSSFAKISIRILADLKQFSTQMQNAQRDMQKMGQNLTKVGQGLSLGITLPVLGLGTAAVMAASDAEETASKFKVVFKDIAAEAKASSDLLRNSYGLSSQASNQLLGDTGDLLTGFGFSQKSALELSTEVNKLAVDLASFTNYAGGAEGASQALTKALLGERESVKALGISILDADVKARVLANSKQGLRFETERQAKAFATLQLAQEQSKNAIGDYARTSDGFANQMRLLKGRLNDVAVEFGEILLPYVSKLAGFVGALIQKFSSLEPSTKKIILVIAGVAAALGPLLTIAGVLMTTVIPGLIALLPALGTAFTVMTGPIGLVAAALAGVAFMVYKHWGPIKKQMAALANYFVDLYNESTAFRIAIEAVIFTFKSLGNYAKLIFNGLLSGFEGIGRYILDQWKNIGAGLKAILTGNFKDLPGILAKFGTNAAKNLSKTWDSLGADVKTYVNDMKGDLNEALDSITKRKKITFLEENVDASAIEKKVEEAVVNGLVGTEKGKGKAKVKVDLDLLVADLALEDARNELAGLQQDIIDNGGAIAMAIDSANFEAMQSKIEDLNEAFLTIPEASEVASTGLAAFMERTVEIGSAINGAFTAALESTADFFGDFLAGIATGTMGAKELFQGLMGVVGNFMETLGKALISVGVASEAFKNAFVSGFGAIAAGIALVAASGLVKKVFAGGLTGNQKARPFAKGGIVYGPTNALIGEYSGARNNPEVVAPLNKLKDLLGGSGGSGKLDITVKGVLKGTDMHLQSVRTAQYLNRR
jgi:hypothetical protein